MMKLLIVDDERIIRETIASLVDWESLGITLIGTAENGIEAYNIILDEYPEIVLTDIKMPGLGGLDLIQRIHEINPDTQFVILSGYGEFEFARCAMKYGVKHYLLKPCNEEQIIESLRHAKEDYLNTVSKKRALIESNGNISQMVMKNILAFYLQTQDSDMEEMVHPYSSQFEINQVPYHQYYIYYVEKENYKTICSELQRFGKQYFPEVVLYIFYVKGTVSFFFHANGHTEEDSIKKLFAALLKKKFSVVPEFKEEKFENLHTLMLHFVKHIRNYEVIYQVSGESVFPIYNYYNVVAEMYRLVDIAFSQDMDHANDSLKNLFSLLQDISDINLLRQQVFALIIYTVSKQASPNMSDAMEYLLYMNQLTDEKAILDSMQTKLTEFFEEYHISFTHMSLSQKVIACVEENLEKSELSLKWIAENYLFMNVDYLSKRFAKETGMKFSKYLTNLRIQKAKHYMETGIYSVLEIAERVGCGQNPQYFSQIFKKNTGQSPSQYLHCVQEAASSVK